MGVVWGSQVGKLVAHRTGLHECLLPDPCATRKLLERVDNNEVMVICRYLVGGFTAKCIQRKWDPGTPETCPLCGAVDTRTHRILECPATGHVRWHWQSYIDMCLSKWPHWLHGPYAVVPDGIEMPNLTFASRRLTQGVNAQALPLAVGMTRLRLFTDGSCLFAEVPVARIAAYAVTLDLSMTDASIPPMLDMLSRGQPCQPFAVVAQALVPRQQSIHRAEVCAIIQAAEFAGEVPDIPVEIHSDSVLALQEADRAAAGQMCHFPDLGNRLQEVLEPRFQLRKVKAHAKLDELEGLDKWLASSNYVADEAAKAAVRADFQCLLDTHQALQTRHAGSLTRCLSG